ncbi:hypothetical protein BDW42DRAFT_177362 [Aspergillus taichungensis]|uniref:Uncharacterized protein n=1 Tax=Aspergillus taichungensis TaxID=482145 RepID=A0A2J5HJA3_9EURO|nr:hypothetical protein BDW42DRAFT_177362 [Aspergillus taichungensis]
MLHPSVADRATTAPEVILVTPYAPGTRDHYKHPSQIQQLQDDLQGIVGGDSHAAPTVVGYTLDDGEEGEGYAAPTHGKVLISYNPFDHLEWSEEEQRDYIYSSVDIWTGDVAQPVHSRMWRATIPSRSQNPVRDQRSALAWGGRPDEAEARHAPMDRNRLNLNLQEQESLSYFT